MPNNPGITDILIKDIDKVRELLEKGVSYNQISKIYKTSNGSVTLFCKKYLPETVENKEKYKNDVRQKLIETVLQYNKEGMTDKEIAEKLNTTHTRINEIVRMYRMDFEPEEEKIETFEKSKSTPVLPDVVINGKRYKDRFYDFTGW